MLVSNNSNKLHYAAKMFSKKKLRSNQLFIVITFYNLKLNLFFQKCAINELEIYKRLQFEHIVKFIEFYEDEISIIILMELICGGELYKRLKKIKRYKEKDAALLIHNLVLSL